MKHHALFLFFLVFLSFFATKGSIPDIPVHIKNKYSAFSGPTVSQKLIETFNPIRCTGTFYENNDIIILEKKNSNSLIVICPPQMVADEKNKNNLLQLVADKNQKTIECIISSDRIGWGIVSMFKEHVLNNPNNVNKFVSLSDEKDNKNDFCFFVHSFQIIELTPDEQKIRRNEKIKMVIVEILKMVGAMGCIYLLLSYCKAIINLRG